mmetsp:Transcript_5153/g.11942  ORF Transcript_5153/g.11942 Transcript_5153/m.11942 type:complete len:222 (-) Transcript_5153:77-742(-)|eukprot:CAMPEP_0168172948 /NCGR_PEP_ID=MMETSP0139_2-20121125/5578_1 /TAXON_ID=44445 /ORGANISM="Pseudo-nitzschia australis, Strain 10249 10 AB" /LENGTH=221 /DNA_ID=CAMNT_0008090737 /DNA_START=215 /DNA_END=883 /DNA_ORIENTATION=+
MKSFLSLAAWIGASTLASAQNNPLVIGDEAVFVYEPFVAATTPTGAAAAAATATKDCNYATVKDLCKDGDFQDQFPELFQSCRILAVTTYMNNVLLDEGEDFTLFLPVNEGVGTLFQKILGQGNAGSTLLAELFGYGLVEGSKLEPEELECKSKVDVVTGEHRPPKIFCKGTITGGTNAYVKGKKNTKYVPKILNPSDPIKAACNAHIYLMTDVILLSLPP